jgi:CheY-like chemotaxis protein
MALILVIDDDLAVRNTVHALLQRRGIAVLVADNGVDGIRHLESFAIDLAIVDIFMPDMDGLEVIRAFSRHTPPVPIIAMSGALPGDRYAAPPDFLDMAGRLGAARCLRKPFSSDQLMIAIQACLGASLAEPRHDAEASSIAPRTGGTSRQGLHAVGCATESREIEA